MQILQNLQRLTTQAKLRYQEFRLYDAASYMLNHLTPRQSFELNQDIAYGTKARQLLDIYRTKHPLPQRPVIVFVHGGAWQHGDKKDYVFIGEAFTREGYDVVVLNYHLAPQHIFPSYIDDLTLALNYLDQHHQELHISTEQLILMGHSAGAFNVMSAIYHPTPYTLECRSKIKVVIGIAGPYHFDYKGDPIAQDAFDQTIPYHEVMPYYFVDHNPIRHCLVVAENDQVVKKSNSDDLDQQLRQCGNYSQIVMIPKTGHITVLGSLSSLFSWHFQTKQSILNFLDEALKAS